MTGPRHDRARFIRDSGPLPTPIRIYPPYFDDEQEELLQRIKNRDLWLRRCHPLRTRTQLELDRANLLYLLADLRGQIERQRWMVELPTDSDPREAPS